MSRDAFVKWWKGNKKYDHEIERQIAQDGWMARQPEIDALKAENEQLKKEIEDLTSDLKDCQEQLIEGNS